MFIQNAINKYNYPILKESITDSFILSLNILYVNNKLRCLYISKKQPE